MEHKRIKKALSILLTIVFLLGMIPVTATADTRTSVAKQENTVYASFSKESYNVMCGKTFDLAKYIVTMGTQDQKKGTWKSSDPKYVSVDSKGIVKAIKTGKDVLITYKDGDSTASCKIRVVFKDTENTSEFWFKPANFLAAKGIVKGYDGNTVFKPLNECTRAQMVTFLWRLAGEPDTKSNTCKFPDVKKTDYFYKPVIWAVEKGITTGYKDGTFKPQNVCTRAQTVTFLWRMAGTPKAKSSKNPFPDVKKTDYFYKATLWASEQKILAGLPNGKFNPQGKCLRRQMVTFLYKYNKSVKGEKDDIKGVVDNKGKTPTPTPLPDYFVIDNKLYITRIDYSIHYAVGQNKYVYETPWERNRETYDTVIIRGYMNCIKDESRKGADYVNLTGLFIGDKKIKYADGILDMNGVIDGSFMFAGCENLLRANVVLNGTSVNNVSHFFEEDKRLITAEVSFGPSKPKILKRMFYDCKSMTSGMVYLSSGHVVDDCYEMYAGCSFMPSVTIDFDIGPDTHFGGMFFDCDSLRNVKMKKVEVTKAGQNMFNNINSITDYHFADDWKVDTKELCDPIGDDYLRTELIPVSVYKAWMFEFHIYSKKRTEWSREFYETYYQVDGWLPLYNSDVLDIYFSGSSNPMGYDETDIVMSMIDPAIDELIDRIPDDEYKEACETLNKIRGDVDILMDFAESILDFIQLVA